MAALGFRPAPGTVATIPETVATIPTTQADTPAGVTNEEANKAAIKALQNAFQGFGLPFIFGRASGNPMSTLFSTLLTTLKNSNSVNNNNGTAAVLDIVSHIVNNMQPDQDPIQSVVETTSVMGLSLAGGVMEAVPQLVSVFSSMLFNTQSRAMDNVLSDVTGLLNGVVDTFMQSFQSIAQLPAYLTTGLTAAINNITSISSDKGGMDGFFDIAGQAIGSANLIIDQLNNTVHDVTRPIMDILKNELRTGIDVVNDDLEVRINDALNSLANGSMSKCAAPITSSMRLVGDGLLTAVESCLEEEIANLLSPLATVETALLSTQATLSSANHVLSACFNWNFWECGWNVRVERGVFYHVFANLYFIFQMSPTISAVLNMSGAYVTIPAQATAVYSTIQTRLPACIAIDAVAALKDAAMAALPLSTCVF